MGLLRKFFRDGKDKEANTAPGPASSQFHESETTSEHGASRNAPRRELVQVVLRDTQRKHGIPSDWIESRILSVVSRSRLTGMHVTFIIRDGEDRLFNYVHAFQDSFWRELEKYEPRARDWLFSVSWQFDGKGGPAQAPMPAAGLGAPAVGAAAPGVDSDVEEDLKALYAIRDAALKQTAPSPADQPDFEPTQPGEADDAPRR